MLWDGKTIQQEYYTMGWYGNKLGKEFNTMVQDGKTIGQEYYTMGWDGKMMDRNTIPWSGMVK